MRTKWQFWERSVFYASLFLRSRSPLFRPKSRPYPVITVLSRRVGLAASSDDITNLNVTRLSIKRDSTINISLYHIFQVIRLVNRSGGKCLAKRTNQKKKKKCAKKRPFLTIPSFGGGDPCEGIVDGLPRSTGRPRAAGTRQRSKTRMNRAGIEFSRGYRFQWRIIIMFVFTLFVFSRLPRTHRSVIRNNNNNDTFTRVCHSVLYVARTRVRTHVYVRSVFN